MSYRDEVMTALREHDGDIALVAKAILNGPRNIALYVIQIGLEKMKSRTRATKRRELRSVIQPQFRAGRTTGSVVLTPASKSRMASHMTALIEDWHIGNLILGNMTREQLLSQAEKEMSSAKGSIRNANFYRALAEPLRSGQAMRAYWTKETASKVRDKIWKETERQQPALV